MLSSYYRLCEGGGSMGLIAGGQGARPVECPNSLRPSVFGACIHHQHRSLGHMIVRFGLS
jgi:hypothetical protein